MLKQIKYFVTVVRCNSFTEAAEECFISQSAISQQIQSLEAELGVQLIKRENRKFHLTPAGEYFYEKSVVLLDEVEKICADTKAIEKNNRKKLRIGYLNSYVGAELHSAVADFSFENSDIDIEIFSGTHEELFDMHSQKSIDMMFSDQRRAFSEHFYNIPVFTAFVHIELSAKHRLADVQNIKITDLINTPCIIIADRSHIEQEKAYYKNYLGFNGSFIISDNLENARMQVSAGRGFLMLEGANNLPQMGKTIKRIPLYNNDGLFKRNYFIYWLKEKTDTIYQSFADVLIDEFKYNS